MKYFARSVAGAVDVPAQARVAVVRWNSCSIPTVVVVQDIRTAQYGIIPASETEGILRHEVPPDPVILREAILQAKLVTSIGLEAASSGDASAPGMVLRIGPFVP